MFTCVKSGKFSLVIKKSEFIAYSYIIGGREEVKQIIAQLKKQHPEARHVCYGYIADESGDDFGYDDDGEPSGTAGKPIYSALASAGVRRSLVAVVRYFGGIKLGAGGLTRAYRDSASKLLEVVGTAKADRMREYAAECDYAVFKKAQALLRGGGCEPSNIVYNDNVAFTVTSPSDIDVPSLLSPLGIVPQLNGETFAICEEL